MNGDFEDHVIAVTAVQLTLKLKVGAIVQQFGNQPVLWIIRGAEHEEVGRLANEIAMYLRRSEKARHVGSKALAPRRPRYRL